jgi:predicted amidohydrolase YtcJ
MRAHQDPMRNHEMEEVDLLITAGCAVTVDKARRIHRDAAVAVNHGNIVAIGSRDEVVSRYVGRKRVDAPHDL